MHRPRPSGCTPPPATRRTASRSWRPASSTCAWSAALPEVRIDPLTGLKTIVAADRATRPGEQGFRADPAPPIDPEGDPFVEGHEDRTPPEVYAVRPNGGAPDSPGWTVRVVPNLYPALAPDTAAPLPAASPDLFTATAARGAHEVIVNGPQAGTALAGLPT